MSTCVWDEIDGWVRGAGHDVKTLAGEPAAGAATLRRLGVTSRSALGAITLHSGGWLVDHGWIRVLGGTPSPGFPDIASASGVARDASGPPAAPGLLVAYDVLGGEFAINGGGLTGQPGGICYHAPDSLKWEPFGAGHTDFVHWVLDGDHALFYDGYRWDGWESDTEALAPDQAWSFYPFMWTREFDPQTASRRAVPLREVLAANADLSRQLPNAHLPFVF
jgi:hypothetical protein